VRYRWRLPNHRWEAISSQEIEPVASGTGGDSLDGVAIPQAAPVAATVFADDDKRYSLNGNGLGDTASTGSHGFHDWANLVSGLSNSINVPKSVASILVSRGIRTFEEARDFFRPSLERLHDPYLMKDMEKAVERIKRAIEQGERVTIYGDYDVDGTTSTAMLTLFLESIGAQVTYHIPDRFTEGYGLSTAGIDRCLISPLGKPGLIISIDCGVTAIAPIAYAREHGVDVIVCDHHEPGDALPDAYAILNPLRKDCSYPYKNLCGCGVGFKLMQALGKEYGVEDKVPYYLDFVALASSADIVSLKGENRILTYYGMRLINDHPRPGVRALIDSANIKAGKLGTNQVVFGLAPRINAAGRLGDGGRSVRLLMAKTQEEAILIASELELENANRRRIDEEAFFEACELVSGVLKPGQDKVIVLHNPTWHAGVIGIVASRLVERYHLPVVLLTTIDGVAKGSARSIMGFDIHSALKKVEDKLITFGGHKYAAGVSVSTELVPEFRIALNSVAKDMISEEMLQPEIEIDSCIELSELTPKLFAIVRQFSPFGPDNTRPMFYAENVEIVGYPRIVGKATPHLKLNVRGLKPVRWDAKQSMQTTPNLIPFTLGGATIEAMGFGLGERINELMGKDGMPRKDLSIVFYLDENEYNGKITPQLIIRDFQ
jgi:single-stranded-DNA-specific exonuclease